MRWCVCVCVCIFLCVCGSSFVRVFACAFLLLCVSSCWSWCVGLYVGLFVCGFLCVCVGLCVCVCVSVLVFRVCVSCVCVCISRAVPLILLCISIATVCASLAVLLAAFSLSFFTPLTILAYRQPPPLRATQCSARSPPTLLPLSTYWSINSHSIGLIFSLHRGACQIHHAGDCMNVSLISRLLSGGEGDYATGGAVVSARCVSICAAVCVCVSVFCRVGRRVKSGYI